MSILGTAIGAGTSLIGGILGKNSASSQAKQQAKLAYEYWQKQYATQRKDALADYERQRKDYLEDISQSAIRQKNALKAAGLNPAMMNESGFSPAAQNASVNEVSPSGIPVADTTSQAYEQWNGALRGASEVANLALINSQKRKNDADAKKSETESDKLRAEFENWRDNQKDLQNNIMLQQWYQSIENVVKTREESAKTAEEQLTIKKQREEISKHIEQMQASINAITFDVSRQKALLPNEIRKQSAEIAKLLSAAALDRASASESSARTFLTNVQSHFAKMGIGIGNNFIDSALALFASGNGKELLDGVAQGLKDLYTTIAPSPYESGKQFGKGASESIKDSFSNFNKRTSKPIYVPRKGRGKNEPGDYRLYDTYHFKNPKK